MKKFIAESIDNTSDIIIVNKTHLSCGLMTYIEADNHVIGVKISHVLKKLSEISDNSDTVLDYANKFELLTNIKSISYLRIYRDYFGQIE